MKNILSEYNQEYLILKNLQPYDRLYEIVKFPKGKEIFMQTVTRKATDIATKAVDELKETTVDDLTGKKGILRWLAVTAICLTHDVPEMPIGKANVNAKLGNVILRTLEA
jgi:hypothetical protein